MPSPIAHSALGYVIYRLSRRHAPILAQESTRSGRPSRLSVIVVGLSMLPDLDALPGIIAGDLARFHNQGMHSLPVGLVVACGAGGVAWLRCRQGVVYWSVVVLVSYEMHIVLDYLTFGRGVMLLWPLTSTRYIPPITPFHGLHWSKGVFDINHLLTIANELTFVALIGLIWLLLARLRQRYD